MSRSPRVSVIVASYNYENLVVETLDSLWAQTCQYALSPGENVLYLRAPTAYLQCKSSLTFNPGKGNVIRLESLRIYADRTFVLSVGNWK